MPIATRSFPPDINPPITQAGLVAGLRDAFMMAGFPPPLKIYTVAGDQFIVWQLNFDPTKTFGRPIYRLRITSALAVSQAVGSSFTDATNTLVNPSIEAQQVAWANNIALKIWGFNSGEVCLLWITQGATAQLLGYFRFADMPSFDENSFPRIFISTRTDVQTLIATTLQPYNSNNFLTSLLHTSMGNADPFLLQRSQALGIYLFAPSNSGIIARSSDDLAMGACLGMTRGETFQVPGADPPQNYILLNPGAGALLIRI